MKRKVLVWTGILISPTVWFLHLEVSFALAPLACSGQGKHVIHVVTIMCLALTAVAAVMSWDQWNRLEPEVTGQSNQAIVRRRAMALSGIALSCLFFLVIVAQSLPSLMMAGCE
jgi:hypothetical protein